MSKQLTISLDYDGTFTADPSLWREFVTAAERRGHRVVCVTARRTPPDFSREPRLPESVPVVLSPDNWKQHAAAAAGHHVTIWIDDMPGVIEPSRRVDWTAVDLRTDGGGNG